MGKELTTRCCLLLLIFVVLGVYYPAIFSPLNSVDDPKLYDFLLNADGLTVRDIFLPGGSGSYYRPVTILSFLVDKYLWGIEASFMHLENVLLHLLSALLVFAVARKAALLQGIRSVLLPFCTALLFAVHPINTEAVNWVSGRTDLLAAPFLLLSLFFAIGESAPPVVILSALCLLVACLAKETAVFFLPAAMLLPFFSGMSGGGTPGFRATLVRRRLHLAAFPAAVAVYFWLRFLAFRQGDKGIATVAGHVAGAESPGWLTLCRLPLKAAGFYLKKLLQPFPLNFGITHVSDLYLPVGLLLCVLVLWLLRRRTLPAFFMVAAASVGCSALLVPLLGFTWTPVAERYMYIPSALFLVGAALAVHGWRLRSRFPRLSLALVGVLVVVGVWGTASRTLLWQDNLALFRDTLQKSPDFTPAQNQIACELYAVGRTKEAAALLLSMNSSKSMSNYQRGLVNKAFACRGNGDFTGARTYLEQALQNPGKCEVEIIKELLKLNEAEVDSGKVATAAVYAQSTGLLERAYRLTGDPFYQYRLGQLHMFAHKKSLARAAFERAARLAPEHAVYREPALRLCQKMTD